MSNTHHYERLIEIFNGCLADEFNIRLIKGNDKSIYPLMGTELPYHHIIFTYGYCASVLHKISHQRVADKARRELVDFGYWYCPDGRDTRAQCQSGDVGVKPQASDWLFCMTAGYPFNVSYDNPGGDFEPDRVVFRHRVHVQVIEYLEKGIPECPAHFVNALQNCYHTSELMMKQFPWPEVLN